MNQFRGFSLTEVLLALLLFSGLSLALLAEQTHLMRHHHKAQLQIQALHLLDNLSECLLDGLVEHCQTQTLAAEAITKRFKVLVTRHHHSAKLVVKWLVGSEEKTLQRTISI